MAERRCEVSELAERDLDAITEFIAADSPKAALRFVSGLRSVCQTLTEHPARHRLREEYGSGVRVVTHGMYLIFYADRGDAVVIERVIHGSRHLDFLKG